MRVVAATLVAGARRHGLLTFVVVRGLLPGTADCAVTVGDRTVELDTDEAEAAASSALARCGSGSRCRTARRAGGDVLDFSERDARVVASALTGRAGTR